jgi:GAF domain-containing protein
MIAVTVADTHTLSAGTRLGTDTLYGVIGVVSSSPDLDRVLHGVVDLLTEATSCHACFVYLLHGERLRLRAASRPFAQLVGSVEFGRDEGVAGWVAREGRPEFIREEALADPRMKYVPEMQEERFQSLAAIPIPARSGETLGVVVLHTVAPREFNEGVITLLTHTASLVAGAIENAKLYEDARRRVERLADLSALGQRIAAVPGREELYGTVASGVRSLLASDRAELYLLDAATGALQRTAADPHDGADETSASFLELLRRRRQAAGTLVAPVAAGDEELGVLVASGCHDAGDEEDELLRAVAGQLAVALKKVELIERLTAENLVRDVFGAMEAGATDVAEARARAAGCDLTLRHIVVQLERAPREGHPWPAVAERAEARMRRLHPAVLIDVGPRSLRALVPLTSDGDAGELERALDGLASAERLYGGLSGVRPGVQEGRESLREAADAATIAGALLRGRGGALRYRDLGTYKYLVRLPLDQAPQDRYCTVVERLMAYDRRRRSHLVATLEQYLRERGSVATTAKALYIHPNTLRQRLGRIEKLTGLRLAEEDLLSLDIATKLVRLRDARPAAREEA